MSWQIKYYVIFMYFKWWHRAQYLFFVIFDFEQEKLVTRYHGDDMVGPIQRDSFPHQWNLLLDLKIQTSTIKKATYAHKTEVKTFLLLYCELIFFLNLPAAEWLEVVKDIFPDLTLSSLKSNRDVSEVHQKN